MQLLLATLLAWPALAEPPLAIPAEPPPRARSATTAEALKAIRKYRSELLSVHNITEYYSSGYYVSHQYGWWPYGGMSVGYAPMWRTDDWVVFKGTTRVDVPTYLRTIGLEEDAAQLSHRIRRKRGVSTGLYALGGAGLVASIVGLVQMDTARTRTRYEQGAVVSGLGSLGMVVGFIAGSFPASKARSLRDRPSYTLERAQVQLSVDDYNEDLRVELGLTPDQALRAEEQLAPR